jgi:hypothetical protein
MGHKALTRPSSSAHNEPKHQNTPFVLYIGTMDMSRMHPNENFKLQGASIP